jgi:hypothetical protein
LDIRLVLVLGGSLFLEKWNRRVRKKYKIEGLILTSHSCFKNIKE